MKLEEVKQKRAEAQDKDNYYELWADAAEYGNRGMMEEAELLAKAYAEQKCKEQREICAENATIKHESPNWYDINKESITEAPSPKFD